MYKDCLVSDVNKFLYGLEADLNSQKPKLLSDVQTLQIYLSPNRGVASYWDLLLRKARWEDIGCAREIMPGITSEFTDIAAFDYLQNEIAGHRFQQGPRVRPGLFQSLRRVCMSTNGDQRWGTHHDHHTIDQYFQLAWLPTILLGLPSVDHYCQSIMLGPLAVTNTLHIPTHPPKVATYHSPHRWGFWDLNKLPPIIKGSVNRYMSPHPIILHNIDDGELRMTAGVRSAFHPLLEMLEVFGRVLVQKGDRVEGHHMDTSMYAETTIEVYNFIQLGSGGNTRSDLAQLQKVLDSVVDTWKVVLKDKADCPPCSACGFEYPGSEW